MIVDFLIKPMKGQKFKILRDLIMGYSKTFNLLGGDEFSSILNECIGTILVPNGTKNNIVDQASYNRYSVLGEID